MKLPPTGDNDDGTIDLECRAGRAVRGCRQATGQMWMKLPNRQLVRFFQKFRREWSIQPPGNVHWPAAHMVGAALAGRGVLCRGCTGSANGTDSR